ncbi:MAG: transcriptional regulator GfcR [Haloarculaceae archaeon]
MKNIDDLIDSAAELAADGLSKGEIGDELNVSRETAAWLVERSDAEAGSEERTGPQDIHVDWSAVGRDGARLSYVGMAMADHLSKQGEDVDLTVGIGRGGAPLATTVSRELDTDLAIYTPSKHRWNDQGDVDLSGSFSRNFAKIRGRECYIVDDTITTGRTMTETVGAVRERNGNPVACATLTDKRGVESLEGVPVYPLLRVLRVDDE